MTDFHSRNEELLERLTLFSEKLLILSQKLPKTLENRKLLEQLIPSGTAMGANYNEACEAESSKDFVHKIKICKKEAKETKYWLRLLQIVESNKTVLLEIRNLRSESEEYVKIFSSISSKFKR